MIDEALSGTIADALKACAVLEIDYQAGTDPAPRRRAIVPYGVLAGARRYLVGRPEEATLA
jgi:predicted DNA-binding transcriptional regulator YafY